MSEQRDIVERLRDREAVVLSGLFHAIPTMAEAAVEIVRLRFALKDIAQHSLEKYAVDVASNALSLTDEAGHG